MVQAMNRDHLRSEFQFLARREFVEAEVQDGVSGSGVHVSFSGPQLRVEASYNDRDGFDCELVFLSHPETSISVGTLLAALRQDETVSARSGLGTLRDQAEFIQRQLDKLLSLPSDVLDDCRALRFYHAGPWRKDWGRAIQMDAEMTATELRRLERLRSYFGGNPRRPTTSI